MLLITAKKEPPVAGQRKEEPSVVKESQENQQSVIEDSQPSSDAENIQASRENKAIHSSNTDLNEALQDKQSPQTSQETISSENDETPLNPRVVSVGQNEVFCAATGRPCTNPSSEHAHVDSASQAETLNSENVDSETRTSPEDSSIDSDSETSTEATQSRQITNDCSSLVNEQNSRSTEHKNDEEAEDEHPENVDATVRT